MTASSEADPTPCPACNAPLMGRYCHDCGQDTRIRPRPLRQMVLEILSETSVIDSKLARTAAALVVEPARLLGSYRSGASSRYVTPIKIFVVTTALFLLTLNFSGVMIYQYVREVLPGQGTIVATADPDGVTVHVTGTVEEVRWMQRRVTPDIDPRITRAMTDAAARATTAMDRENLEYDIQADREQSVVSERLAAWLPNAVWLLMPAYAGWLALFFGRRRLFVEHLVFSMWAHSTAFILLIGLALVNKWGGGLPVWLVLPPYLAYVAIAARRFYGFDWVGTIWRVGLHTGLYFLLVLAPAAIVVAITAMDFNAFLEFMQA